MQSLRLFCCVILLILGWDNYANANSLIGSEDSLNVYQKISRYAHKRKITRWIYEGIFREVRNPVANKGANNPPANTPNPISNYSGKTIARINIVTRDPFGTSINDTLATPHNWLEKGANKIHFKTLPFTVRQQLLFKKGDALDPLKISESGRLLRQTSYTSDASIIVNPINTGDSVAVTVILCDKWSLSVAATVNNDKQTIGIYEDNALGLGHQFENSYNYFIKSPANSYFNGKYTINNIAHSYVNAVATYDNNPIAGIKAFSVGRGFYSSLTKWAGGLDLGQYKNIYNATPETTYPVNYQTEDSWLGRSFPLSNKNVAGRSTAIIFAARVANTYYTQQLPVNIDSTHNIQNSRLYLGSIGFSSRHYYRDKNIYRFGVTEDVPEGRLLSFTGGYELRSLDTRYYTGIRLAVGNHIQSGGYFSWAVEYGTYYNENRTKNGVVNTSATWFSDLFYFGKWSTRQFIYYRGVFGLDRQTGETVNLQGSQGLLGFSSDVLGSSKLALNLQSIVYTPVDVIGFKLSTVLFAGYGSAGGSYESLIASKIYQVYGIGLLIRNENLVIRTFSFSFGFYPNVPSGYANYKYNPINSFNVNFPGFSVDKPSQIAYQ